MDKDVLETPKRPGWAKEGVRVVSTSSDAASSSHSASLAASAPSNELCALINFAYRLRSTVKNNDPGIKDHSDVCREAKLLMSLSCASPGGEEDHQLIVNHHHEHHHINSSSSSSNHNQSGRVTPQSVASSSSGGSRRDTFSFTCPSLSLEGRDSSNGNNHHVKSVTNGGNTSCRVGGARTEEPNGATPATMLGRTLKVDDKDAMRLSSEAMARNVMQSFQKAMEWRVHSWVNTLSAVLVDRERAIQGKLDADKLLSDLLYSNEALLVAALRQIESKIQVQEASTAFKVLHKIYNANIVEAPAKKKQRLEEERMGLEEGEYVYDVIHVLEMQCDLNVSTPAGHVHIDINVPGRIKGTFLSSEDNCNEELTDVSMELNTGMLATMIEKSSRIAVRASVEALLKGEYREEKPTEERPVVAAATTTTAPAATATPPIQDKTALPAPKTSFSFDSPTKTSHKRNFSDEQHSVSGLVVITPARDASSPSSYGDSDSDGDNKPVLLQIPDNFTSRNQSGAVLYPQPSRAREGSDLAFAKRLPPKTSRSSPQPTSAVVSPMKKAAPQFETREQGPNLPVLLEVACAAMDEQKK